MQKCPNPISRFIRVIMVFADASFCLVLLSQISGRADEEALHVSAISAVMSTVDDMMQSRLVVERLESCVEFVLGSMLA